MSYLGIIAVDARAPDLHRECAESGHLGVKGCQQLVELKFGYEFVSELCSQNRCSPGSSVEAGGHRNTFRRCLCITAAFLAVHLSPRQLARAPQISICARICTAAAAHSMLFAAGTRCSPSSAPPHRLPPAATWSCCRCSPLHLDALIYDHLATMRHRPMPCITHGQTSEMHCGYG